MGADLEQLNGNEKSLANRILRIPTKHADAWLSALNQARLVIAAKNNFTELELCDHLRSPIGSRRDLSLFQVNFYGFLQEFILREMDCRAARKGGNQALVSGAFTIDMRRSLMASDDFAGRKLNARAACKHSIW